jgi:hypothetical protein
MTRPDVTLQPSKGVVTQAAAQIYAAHISAGQVDEEHADRWIRRSIRAAIAIARTIDASVQSDAELPSGGGASGMLQPAEETSVESISPTPATESATKVSAAKAAEDALSMEDG